MSLREGKLERIDEVVLFNDVHAQPSQMTRTVLDAPKDTYTESEGDRQDQLLIPFRA